jgi:hypothetical protein
MSPEPHQLHEGPQTGLGRSRVAENSLALVVDTVLLLWRGHPTVEKDAKNAPEPSRDEGHEKSRECDKQIAISLYGCEGGAEDTTLSLVGPNAKVNGTWLLIHGILSTDL